MIDGVSETDLRLFRNLMSETTSTCCSSSGSQPNLELVWSEDMARTRSCEDLRSTIFYSFKQRSKHAKVHNHGKGPTRTNLRVNLRLKL